MTFSATSKSPTFYITDSFVHNKEWKREKLFHLKRIVATGRYKVLDLNQVSHLWCQLIIDLFRTLRPFVKTPPGTALHAVQLDITQFAKTDGLGVLNRVLAEHEDRPGQKIKGERVFLRLSAQDLWEPCDVVSVIDQVGRYLVEEKNVLTPLSRCQIQENNKALISVRLAACQSKGALITLPNDRGDPKKVTRLDFSGGLPLTSELIAQLAEAYPQVSTIQMNETAATLDVWKSIGKFQNLTALKVCFSQLGDEEFSALVSTCKVLLELDISGTQVKGENKVLEALPATLRTLRVGGCIIAEELFQTLTEDPFREPLEIHK